MEVAFKPFEHHVYSVLQESTIGHTTSLYQQLEQGYNLRKAEALLDHDYCKETFYLERIDGNDSKVELIAKHIQRTLTPKGF